MSTSSTRARGAGVDASQLEEVVDHGGEQADLALQRAEVVRGLDDAVLDGLEHRPERGDRGPEVVAGPGDQLAARIEDLFEMLGHRVERAGELGDLRRATLGGALAEFAAGQATDAARTRSRWVVMLRATTEGADHPRHTCRQGDGRPAPPQRPCGA